MAGIPLGGSRSDLLARMLLQNANSPRPIQHPMQGVSKLANALAARSRINSLEERQQQQEQALMGDQDTIIRAMQSGKFAGLDPSVLKTPQGRQMLAQALSSKAPERKVIKGADGYQYYMDTGERVLPGISAPAKPREKREIKLGDEFVTQEFDPKTGDWVDVARAGRYKPVAPSATATATGSQPDDPFIRKMKERDAETFTKLMDAGIAANRNLARINQLEQMLEATPTGGLAAFKAAAGNWGIPTEGLDDLQSAQALINSLVPEQRPPGSGPMSDADLELFKQSLPRLINQPGGNAKIIKTLREIAMYDRKIGEIANEVAALRISRDEGRKKMNELGNPLSGFLGKTTMAEDKPPEGIDPEDWKYMSDSEKALFR